MNRKLLPLVCCAGLLPGLCSGAYAGTTLLSVSFAAKAWDPAAWVLAKNPKVNHFGQWVQRDQCIENETPTAGKEKRALAATLTTMVYNKPFSGDYTVSATFQIGAGSAPGIVLAKDFAPDADGHPQYGEFYEAIIYEKGINLWHHFLRDGKPAYEKTAYATFPLQPDTSYKFEVQRKGKTLQMTVDGRTIGVLVPSLPDNLYLGVEGCEGVSRVYDFAVVR